MTNDEYFADKIEREVSFYESRVQRINADYLAQVEKLAKHTEDSAWAKFRRDTLRPGLTTPELNDFRRRLEDGQLWAKFYRDIMQPNLITAKLNNIRLKLEDKQLQEADACLKTLKMNIEVVDRALTTPIFQKGLKFPGGSAKRRDVLTRLIEDSLERLGGDASPDKVLEDIRDKPGIQEIDEETKTVFWRAARGKHKETKFKSFQNRVGNRRPGGKRRKVLHKISSEG